MDELNDESGLFEDLYDFIDRAEELYVDDPAFAEVAINGLVGLLDITE